MAGTQSGAGEENLTKDRKNEDAGGTLHGGDRELDSGGNDENKRGKRRHTHPSNGEDKDSDSTRRERKPLGGVHRQ